MKYLLTLWGDESEWESMSPEQLQEEMGRWDAYWKEASEAGVVLSGEGLAPTTAATTLRTRRGEQVVTDGPFAETKEQLGGYYLLECRDLDHAIEWAKKVPAGDGSIEIRPVMDVDSTGSQSS